MNKPTIPNVPMWKLVLYGFIAAFAVSGYGVYRSQYPLVICGFFAGVAIFGFGFLLNKSLQGDWGIRHLRLLLTIYGVLQTALLIWTLMEKH
jgi:hypothetical protein